MRRAAKTDANHQAIVRDLRRAGATVQSLAAVGDGCPDLLVGYRGVDHLLEIKDGSKSPSQQKLTPDQVTWHREWCGSLVKVVRNSDQALDAIGAMNIERFIASIGGQ